MIPYPECPLLTTFTELEFSVNHLQRFIHQSCLELSDRVSILRKAKHCRERASPAQPVDLQRVKEREQFLLLRGAQLTEAMGDMVSFTFVPIDGVFEGQRFEVVHVAWSHAQTPQCGSAHFVCGVLRGILYDTITCSHVMQQEVAEWMNDFIPQGVGHGEGSTIYYCSRGSGGDRFDVAGIATDLLEESLAGLSGCGRCEGRIARRHFGSANELRKVVDVGQAEIVGRILGIGSNFADRSGVVGPQTVGNTHFVQIGVADKVLC